MPSVSKYMSGANTSPDEMPTAPLRIASRMRPFIASVSPGVGLRSASPITWRRTCPSPTIRAAFVPMPWAASLDDRPSMEPCMGHAP